MNCPVITSTTEVPRTVVRPKHVHLDRWTQISLSALAGRNVGVYLTEVWYCVVRFERTLASLPTLTGIFFQCCDVTEGGHFPRHSTSREPVVRAHDRRSRVGDSDVSGDGRRSMLGRLVDLRIHPRVELNTERANIHTRMNYTIKITCRHVHYSLSLALGLD
ncbi:hypothetical protein NP493_126g00017 [Ridgeia piscesae]|uniref:Uncharacterized protein n=1 Tax=Ridgeia piscesae TaxID=27915 RepID=A0AAD9P627_RIDPI|nr:hypothetical protein NP493_126g00017 [Ridgeia piscesae]